MFKDLLIVAYIASIIYCLYQLSITINDALDLFHERHPTLPVDETPGWKGVELGVELLALSSIPVANVMLGCACASLSDSVIEEIVSEVETKYWSEIRKWEIKEDSSDENY